MFLLIVYGLTESMGSIINLCDKEFISGDVGQVAPNMELKIIDLQTGNALPPNQDGEICIRGPIMFKGYLNNPEATAATIDKNGWLHTGDIGHYNEQRHLFITDRIKELIKFKGYSVPPAEVEDLLLRHEAIKEAAVVGVPHKTDTQWLRAYVTLKDGYHVDAADIKKYVEGNFK